MTNEAITVIDDAESVALDALLDLPVLGYAGADAEWPGSPLVSRPAVLHALNGLSQAIMAAALAATPTQSGAEGPTPEQLAAAIWDTSDAAEERPFVDATMDQRATAIDWAVEILDALRSGAEVAAAPGLDSLTEAVEAALTEYPPDGHWSTGWAQNLGRKAVVPYLAAAILARLTANPVPTRVTGLDAERLAHALKWAFPGVWENVSDQDTVADATAIAAEYARLTAKP